VKLPQNLCFVNRTAYINSILYSECTVLHCAFNSNSNPGVIIIIINYGLSQCPWASNAWFTKFWKMLLSSAEWLRSCRLALHHSMISSTNFLCGHPLLCGHTSYQKTSIFNFLSADLWHMVPVQRAVISITVCSRLRCLSIFLCKKTKQVII